MKVLESVWTNKSKRIWVIIGMILLSRLVFYAMGAILSGDFSLTSLLDFTNRFDSYHYKDIIENGYTKDSLPIAGEAGWAFFPLFPMLIRGIYIITGMEIELICLLINSALLLGALIYAVKYIEITGGNSCEQFIYVLLVTFGCYGFYFTLIYSEALALFLLTACFYYLEKKQYLLMGIFGLLLTGARNMGIFFEFVILVKWIMDFCEIKKNEDRKFKDYLSESLCNPSLVLGVALIPAGMFGYMLYLKKLTGDGLAFVHVQYGWGRTNSFFLKIFYEGIREIAGYAPYLAMWAVFGLWLMVILIFKYKKYHEAVFGMISLIIPMQSALDSIPRYMLGAFVFYRCLSIVIKDSKWYNKVMAIGFMLFFELILINGWLLGEGILT